MRQSRSGRNLSALALAGLAGYLLSSSCLAQEAPEAQVAVGALDTDVNVVILQAGEAFAFADATLSESGKEILDAILQDLDKEYVFRVDVSGYTDQIGDEAYNLDLSGRRAQAAAQHLADFGIQPEKINVQAMGSADPIVSCGNMTEEQMIACLAPNRRTEVRFFFPRAHTQGIVLAREKLSTTAGEYISISAASVESTEFGAKAIKVFMEGCRADLDAYCAQVIPGQQRLVACLYAHGDKVSERCRGNLKDAMLLVRAEIAQANFIGALCGADILDHCGDVEPGDGRMTACLDEKRASLSQTCREALDQMPN